MTDLLKEMRDLGLIPNSSNSDPMGNFDTNRPLVSSDLAFSGYGEFTPITIGSSTVFGNANLERNKS